MTSYKFTKQAWAVLSTGAIAIGLLLAWLFSGRLENSAQDTNKPEILNYQIPVEDKPPISK